MSEFLEILTHGRRFKAAVKELSVEELRDLADKLDKILVERESMAEEEEQAMAARNAKIEEIRQQMEAVGLSIDDLGGVTVKATAKNALLVQLNTKSKLTVKWFSGLAKAVCQPYLRTRSTKVVLWKIS